MNSQSHLPGKPKVSWVQPEVQRLSGEWSEMLAQCARKPSRKRVHALRSLTLRLRTCLEAQFRQQPPDQVVAHAFQRWKRQCKRLRRALQPVRDADVYLARLGALLDRQRDSDKSKPHLSSSCLRELGKLERCLEQKRKTGVDDLLAMLQRRGKRLLHLCNEVEAGLLAHSPSAVESTAQAAMRLFSELSRELPGLQSANLHKYRKRLKKVLYLAELSSASNPEAMPLARGARKIHLATGDWHDWHALALEAGRILPRRDKKDGAVPMLEKLADEALKNARRVCRRSTARILENANAPHPPSAQRYSPKRASG